MKYIVLPSSARERLVYYLAAEEYLASVGGEGFFLWQSRPTVIFGRNQDMEAEVNVPYCLEHGVEMYRRKSGGGCVYSDPGNLMLSYVVRGTDVKATFAGYLGKLAAALTSLGLDAVTTEHNDVLVNGRKVSGNACFSTGTSVIVHGTLLYDEDFAGMLASITPSSEKLASHSVKSVRQRCINLREAGLRLTMDELKEHIKSFFTSGEQILGADSDAAIRTLEAFYLDPDFLYGK